MATRSNLRRKMEQRAWVLAFALAAVLPPAEAFACGACVSPPAATGATFARQSAERIFFYRNPQTKHSTVWVEVSFAGNPKDFGWVVPMPKTPTIGVGSRYLFDRLDQATAPRFELEIGTQDETCPGKNGLNGGCSAAPAPFGCAGMTASATDNGLGLTGNQHVNVVVAAQTGPYDYAVVKGDTSQNLLDWLNASGFATPPAALPIIDAHIKKGDVFVAFRLHDGAGVQSIRPVTFAMDDAEPCVPLRLTSIAAVDEMSVIVYLAGPGRGLPKNSLHVQVNPLRLNWNAPASNYAQVLSAAIDEAGSHAFATEFAGDVSSVTVDATDANALGTYLFEQPVADSGAFGPGALFNKAALDVQILRGVKTPKGLIDALQKSGLPLTPELFALLNAQLGVDVSSAAWLLAIRPTPENVYNYYYQPDAGSSDTGAVNAETGLPTGLTVTTIDGPALADAIEKDLMVPLLNVIGEIWQARTLTRLALRISPAEMTRDPVFAFEPSLPAVENLHRALMHTVQENCAQDPAAARLTLPEIDRSYVVRNGTSGYSSFGMGGSSGLPTANNATEERFAKMPAALRVELLDENAAPVQIAAPQVGVIDAALADAHAGTPSLPANLVVQKEDGERVTLPPSDPPVRVADVLNASTTNPGGCSLGQRPGVPYVLGSLLLVCATVLARRRRS